MNRENPGTSTGRLNLVFACAGDNDLYQVLKNNGISIQRFDTPEKAIQQAGTNAGVLILADNYPDKTAFISEEMLQAAAEKKLRLYLEYPSFLLDKETEDLRHTHWERAVVSSDAFGSGLRKLRILGLSDCHFIPVDAEEAHIVVARVAGLDTALYGLPEETWPILFEYTQYNALIATTKLSQFVKARYAPVDAWQAIWKMILEWLQPGEEGPILAWTPTVQPSYTRAEALPADAEYGALRRGAEWFIKSRLLVHESWTDEVENRLRNYHDGVAPAPEDDVPMGDGKCGLLEGYNSTIKFDGTQPVRYYFRNDCNGEASMALAFGGTILHKPSYKEIAANLSDFTRFNSAISQGERADRNSPSYGLLGWDTRPEGSQIYYGDDNARALLGVIATSALLKTDRWDESTLRNLFANLRTTGIHGFRENSLRDQGLQEHGWQHYLNSPTINYAPHYQAYLWATFLWAYKHTGYKPFLDKTKTAIRMTMKAYPDQWRWTNGIQQERARMLLPLAWLVRAEDTPEHRQWLQKIAQEMIKGQAECGAIREELGDLSKGGYPPPRSNEDYGTNEASLISKNGDPVCDLLYTTNFAYIGLHEAATAIGDPMIREAEDKLTEFLCRIQVRSDTHQQLDGAWLRAFEFNRWDYWASNADAGWGAWSIESGWTQGWITAVLGMRHMDTSLWDLTADSKLGEYFDKYSWMVSTEG